MGGQSLPVNPGMGGRRITGKEDRQKEQKWQAEPGNDPQPPRAPATPGCTGRVVDDPSRRNWCSRSVQSQQEKPDIAKSRFNPYLLVGKENEYRYHDQKQEKRHIGYVENR